MNISVVDPSLLLYSEARTEKYENDEADIFANDIELIEIESKKSENKTYCRVEIKIIESRSSQKKPNHKSINMSINIINSYRRDTSREIYVA